MAVEGNMETIQEGDFDKKMDGTTKYSLKIKIKI